MNILIKHLQYLLRHNECVILPGLGAYICHNVPALIDKKKGIVIEPFRYISFNSDIITNDGLLIESVSRGESIPYETAATLINEEIDRIKSTLDRVGFFMFPRIGRIVKKKNTLQFVPDSDSSLYNPYTIYGKEENIVDSENNGISIWSHVNRLMKIAAVITIIASLAYLLYEPVKDSGSYIKASLLPLSEKPVEDEEEFIEIDDFDGILNIAPAPIEKQEKEAPASPGIQKIYGVIIASFDTENQANAFLHQYSNEDLDWIYKDNHYRVYAATSDSLESALSLSASEKMKNKWGSTWVTRIR